MPHSRQRGFSFVEILIVVAMIAVLMTIAAPYYQQAVMDTKHTAAVANIRTLHTAQVQFFSQNNRFATSLRELAGRFISGEFASGEKGGYRYRMEETQSGYAIHAEPVKFGTNGKKTFYSDETMIVRVNDGQDPATVNSPEAK